MRAVVTTTTFKGTTGLIHCFPSALVDRDAGATKHTFNRLDQVFALFMVLIHVGGYLGAPKLRYRGPQATSWLSPWHW